MYSRIQYLSGYPYCRNIHDIEVTVIKGKLRSRKILPLMKVHTMKYLKIAMICSVVNFAANNRGNKIAILLLLAAILFSPNESEAMTSQ